MDNELYLMARKRRLWKIIIIIMIAFIIFTLCFACFQIYVDGRNVLREAKNVKIAFGTADVELYGQGRSIYKRNSQTGLAEGVREYVETIVGDCGEIILESYNENTRTVKGFTYIKDNYRVIYRLPNEGKGYYRVQYMFTIMNYEE